MLDTRQSLLPDFTHGPQTPMRAFCVGLETESLAELERLLSTLDIETVKKYEVKIRQINPATYVAKGKLEQIKAEADRLAELKTPIYAVAFDFELSPNQLKNLEKVLGIPVLDRPGAIIEIFSAHARTKEAKTQVELARLKYLLPRLAHFWTHFERQRGGIGLKGMGEKQIEVDRRLVKKRMSLLSSRLKQIEMERKVHRKARANVLKVAIVGYTNAGKSTLLNALTHSKVLTEDKLFATLDPSHRLMDPDAHPPVVAIDTVGFIRNLPTDLIASFRSTLEEVQEADYLVHVLDAHSSLIKDELEVTEQILKDLDSLDKPRMVVFNKMDLISPQQKASIQILGAAIQRDRGLKVAKISAQNKDDVNRLRSFILDQFKASLETWDVLIPYSEGKVEAGLRAQGSIVTTKFHEKGTFYRIKIDAQTAKRLGLERFKL